MKHVPNAYTIQELAVLVGDEIMMFEAKAGCVQVSETGITAD